MLDLDAELEEYIGLHSEPEPEILQQLSRATHQKILRPRMLSGNLQGQFLKMLCRMNRVQRVLEIGTFTGYAAISMAMGMGEKGVLHTIDINDEIEDFTRNYIERSGLAGQIVFHIGDACEIIPGLDECFDLVFIDADKRQYAAYYRLVFDKVRPGGIIVADDVLWDGKVTENEFDPTVELGLSKVTVADLKGGEPELNAQLFRDFLAGKDVPFRTTALLNAASAIVADGHLVPTEASLADRFKAAYAIAEETVDSGKASALLDQWIATAQSKKNA